MNEHLGSIAAGHLAGAISGRTEEAIITALGRCGCKFIWRDETGQHREIQLGEGLRAVPRRGTYCAMHLEREAPDLASTLLPQGVESGAIDRINLYISPPGSGTPLHFDTRWIIVVQLAGSKLWQVGSGPAIAAPKTNVVADEQGGQARHGDQTLALPERMHFVLLRPGSWLLVPWGTWHGTYSSDGSVSATLAFGEGAAPRTEIKGQTTLTEGPRLLC